MADAAPADVDAAYAAYLARFDAKYGTLAPGSYVKHGRWMVRRMGKPEFVEMLGRFRELEQTCTTIVQAGSTISDAAIGAYAEVAAHLLTNPKDFLNIIPRS